MSMSEHVIGLRGVSPSDLGHVIDIDMWDNDPICPILTSTCHQHTLGRFMSMSNPPPQPCESWLHGLTGLILGQNGCFWGHFSVNLGSLTGKVSRVGGFWPFLSTILVLKSCHTKGLACNSRSKWGLKWETKSLSPKSSRLKTRQAATQFQNWSHCASQRIRGKSENALTQREPWCWSMCDVTEVTQLHRLTQPQHRRRRGRHDRRKIADRRAISRAHARDMSQFDIDMWSTCDMS